MAVKGSRWSLHNWLVLDDSRSYFLRFEVSVLLDFSSKLPLLRALLSPSWSSCFLLQSKTNVNIWKQMKRRRRTDMIEKFTRNSRSDEADEKEERLEFESVHRTWWLPFSPSSSSVAKLTIMMRKEREGRELSYMSNCLDILPHIFIKFSAVMTSPFLLIFSLSADGPKIDATKLKWTHEWMKIKGNESVNDCLNECVRNITWMARTANQGSWLIMNFLQTGDADLISWSHPFVVPSICINE